MSKATTVVTTTTALSAIADAIRTQAETAGTIPSKQHILNTFAHGIAGPKHDWGYMTGAAGAVVQKGISPIRLADLEALRVTKSVPRARQLLAADRSAPSLQITAKAVPLYSAEMAAYFSDQVKDGLIAIIEDFSTDTQNDAGVQCMFEPTAFCVSEDGLSATARTLWAATPALLDLAARANLAASSSQTVNALVDDTILEWPEEAFTSSFKAFYMPHAVIVSTEYPLETLSEIDVDDLEDDEVDEDAGSDNPVDAAIRVFIDETLDETARRQVLAEVEDALIRLVRFLETDDPIVSNISVDL